MKLRTGFLVLLLCGGCFAARAGSLTVTIGIDARCPYGLVTCWGEVRPALTMLPGVKSVGEQVDPHAWTSTIELADGALPDMEVWERTLEKYVRKLFGIRGIEAGFTGEIALTRDGMECVIDGWRLPLKPLLTKIQLDVEQRQPEKAKPEEERAYDDLRGRVMNGESRFKVTGPLIQNAETRGYHMEVRLFEQAAK